MGNRTKALVLAFIFMVSARGYGQGETGVPFLMIPTSVEGNGMGGVAASLITDDAISNFSNPAQLGVFGLSNSLSLSTYSPKTDWLPGFASGLSLDATALSAGLKLNRHFNLPVPISVGVGYSQVYFDLGEFTRVTPDGTVIGTWNAHEKSDLLTVGIGIDYVVKFGLGYSFKWIDSELGPFGTGQEAGTGIAKVPAHDFGAILQVPLIDVVSKLQKAPVAFNDELAPLFDLTFGYAERNVGGGVSYGMQIQSDPLPRQGVLGWNFEAGLMSEVNHRPWKLLTFTWAREAEDVLVSLKTIETVPAPGDTMYTNLISYKGGLGSIRPIDNLLLGKTYGEIALQKGWQIQVAECLYIRGGSNTDVGTLLYQTHGESFHLNGFLKILASLGVWNPRHGWGAYFLSHFDLQYSTSVYTSSRNGFINGTRFSSINIVFK